MDTIISIIGGFFDFINTILSTITEAIAGIIVIYNSIMDLFIKMTYVLPQPLYIVFMSFLSLYCAILIYKLLRKGWWFMFWDLVTLVFGSIPQEFEFLYIFGALFVMYIFLGLFKFMLDILKDFITSIW